MLRWYDLGKAGNGAVSKGCLTSGSVVQSLRDFLKAPCSLMHTGPPHPLHPELVSDFYLIIFELSKLLADYFCLFLNSFITISGHMIITDFGEKRDVLMHINIVQRSSQTN